MRLYCAYLDGDPRSIFKQMETSKGRSLVVIDGNECRTEHGLLSTWAVALSFPEYFGMNWDAFEECINDTYEWHDDDIVIVITHTDKLLQHLDHDTRLAGIRVLLKILAAAGWDDGDPTVSRSELARIQETPAIFCSSPGFPLLDELYEFLAYGNSISIERLEK